MDHELAEMLQNLSLSQELPFEAGGDDFVADPDSGTVYQLSLRYSCQFDTKPLQQIHGVPRPMAGGGRCI
jgi:hypothetical protein